MVGINQQWISDGQVTVTGGVVSHLDPDVLDPSAIAWARNTLTSSGKPSARWRTRELGTLPGGTLNGAGYFSKAGGMIVGSTNGEIWSADFNSGRLRVRYYPNIERNDRIKRAWFCETAESMVIQNNSGTPLIFSGNRLRRASRDEVPRGGPMAYGNGRLFVARGNNVYAGDIVQNNIFQSELKFTEIEYWAGGGAYRMPGTVIGMALIPQSDSSTGFGSLLVFGRDWTVAMRVEILDRLQWSTTPGFVATVFPNIGCISHDSIVAVNQDVYWRSGDGELRSFRQAVLDYQTAGATPLSGEINRLFGHESESVASRSSATYFKNRLLGTTSGFRDRDVVLFRDLFSLDFVPQSRMGQKTSPVYDGEWDGYRYCHVLSGKFVGQNRCMAIVKTDDDEYRLIEIMPESGYDEYITRRVKDEDAAAYAASADDVWQWHDNDERGDEVKSVNRSLRRSLVTEEVAYTVPEAQVEYRRFDFQNRFQMKKLMAADVYLSGLTADTTVEVLVRSDGSPKWDLWDSFQIKLDGPGVVTEVDETLEAGGEPVLDSYGQTIFITIPGDLPPTISPQYRVRLRTRSIEDRVEANTLRYAVVGYSFQVMLKITGPTWTVDRMQVFAMPLDEAPFAFHDGLPFDSANEILQYGDIEEYRVPTGEISGSYADEPEYTIPKI